MTDIDLDIDLGLKPGVSILYGTPQPKLQFNKLFDRLKNEPSFAQPPLDLYSHEKPFNLSREEFYRKYKLDENLNIVCFFPDGMHGHPCAPTSHLQHTTLNEINKLLKEMGFMMR